MARYYPVRDALCELFGGVKKQCLRVIFAKNKKRTDCVGAFLRFTEL
jgi:hypothetical protein